MPHAPETPVKTNKAWAWPVAIVLFAFAIRAANAIFLLQPDNPHYDPARCKGADMWGSDLQAREVVTNRGFPKEFYHHAPLYVYLAAAVYAVTDRDFAVVYWIQVVIGSLLCGLVYWIGTRAWDERVGRIAGLTQALYAPLIFNEVTFMADAIAPAFATGLVAMLIGFQRLERKPVVFAAALGLVLGMTISSRANFALFAPLIAIWMILALRQFRMKKRIVSVLVVAATSFIFVLPFCIHNSGKKEKISFTQVEGDKPWRMSWGTESTGYFFYPRGYPENALLSPMSFGWVPLLARKARFLLSWYEFPDLYNFYIDGRYSPILRWNPISFWLVGPLALFGIFLYFKRARGDLSPIYLALAVHLVSLLLFYVAARFRAAAMPLLILFAASAAVWLFEKAKAREWPRLIVASAATLALMAFSLSLDPSGFHSIWYGDSMVESALLQDAQRAIEKRDLETMRSVANRLLWIKRASAQVAGYSLLAELDRAATDGTFTGANAETMNRLIPLVQKQPTIDQFGGAFFPPTAGFRKIDPLKSISPPKNALGIRGS